MSLFSVAHFYIFSFHPGPLPSSFTLVIKRKGKKTLQRVNLQKASYLALCLQPPAKIPIFKLLLKLMRTMCLEGDKKKAAAEGGTDTCCCWRRSTKNGSTQYCRRWRKPMKFKDVLMQQLMGLTVYLHQASALTSSSSTSSASPSSSSFCNHA